MADRPISNVYAVTLTVHHDERGLRLVPDNQENFVVENNDQIHMVKAMTKGETMSLLLRLGKEFGKDAKIAGLSFGTTSEEAAKNAALLETGDRYYPQTPFKLSREPARPGAAAISIENGANSDRFNWKIWVFDIWLQDSLLDHRIDPKIYNKGDLS